jgi:hypothetical protein
VYILLLAADKTVLPSSLTTSKIALKLPVEAAEVLTFVHPLRAPIRPYWSITQLKASKAKPLDN